MMNFLVFVFGMLMARKTYVKYLYQCYHGAPNMHSKKSGTASWILREPNKAITTHWCSQNLNLSLASTCKLPVVDNALAKYKRLQIYFNSSPKREQLL